MAILPVVRSVLRLVEDQWCFFDIWRLLRQDRRL